MDLLLRASGDLVPLNQGRRPPAFDPDEWKCLGPCFEVVFSHQHSVPSNSFLVCGMPLGVPVGVCLGWRAVWVHSKLEQKARRFPTRPLSPRAACPTSSVPRARRVTVGESAWTRPHPQSPQFTSGSLLVLGIPQAWTNVERHVKHHDSVTQSVLMVLRCSVLCASSLPQPTPFLGSK